RSTEMKSITGALLIVASSIFYLARINAQPINFQSAIEFSNRISFTLFISGTGFIAWDIISNHLKRINKRASKIKKRESDGLR
ncbi:hypothetical protein QEH52_20290, partial [Coraliomargarita sp. SDUM461003]